MFIKEKQQSNKDQIIYCYDLMNKNRAEWAGSVIDSGLTTLKVNHTFYDVSINVLLFASRFKVEECKLVELEDISYGKTLLYEADGFLYAMNVRKQRTVVYGTTIKKDETDFQYQTYIEAMKEAFQNQKLYKINIKKAILPEVKQLELYDNNQSEYNK